MKTEAIAKWKIPSSVKEIKQFLGLCSFFQKTIPNFSTIANPLTKLTRKEAYDKGPLSEEAKQAFGRLKKSLME